MESLLSFVRGPLFRLTFAIMVLGLARIFLLDVWQAYKAYRRADNKKMPWKLIAGRTFDWLFPVKKVIHNRHVYSIFSLLFHVGLILVPVFLFAHINLWKQSVGISWLALPYWWAFGLTVSTIVFGIALLIGRLVIRETRFLSRGQDYLWLILLLIPFITGFICANLSIAPWTYNFLMLVHMMAAETIFVLIPFTKIAHCVLTPLSQVVCAIDWKFPPDTDDAVCTTLNKKGAPV